MKPLLKNALIIGGLLLTGAVILGYKKVNNLMAIFDKMTIRPKSFPKNIRASLTQISFNIDIALNNPTNEDFAVTGYVASLSKVLVYYKGKFLGVANVNIDSVSVPRYGSLVLKDINVIVATTALLENLLTILPQLEHMSSAMLNDLTFVGVVNVLGNEYQIGN